MRVLIIKTSSMGDVIHSLPALTDAMLMLTNTRFDWVVEEDFSEIPSWHPAVYKVIPVAIRRWRKNWFSYQVRKERERFRNELQLNKYDVIIDAQGLIKSAWLITRLAQGIRHGGDFLSVKESLSSLIYDKRHLIKKKQHAVQRIRVLFSKSLNYLLPTTYADYSISHCFSKSHNKDTNQYLVFLHSTTRTSKHWPEHNWRELITSIHNNGLHIKLPWGADHERQRAKRLAQGFNYVEILPKLSLEKLASILVNARAIVSVDTGLSHLASALNRPNITLYGPTNHKLIGINGYNQIALCSSDKKMGTLTTNIVKNALEKVIT
ncbi:lipopolysaccharide heptosyltransferase RfaC [Candidatus Erwinia haradaeae]|uniref:Lipopolysaccharide heptosyltransferase 1 n=1 Tax=Candidatus Erwinia haradaeae TaxID=1922217 RepID=A0A803GCV6_9GAMM|nr:lipopolysaccharide heptosyltransferase RfaC [Candidatus Erwinia haradaeae]VFP88691.1 Lipopolysaccharide heptosyltransferase 1 [Candidatus Erwinia haradaeae]